MTLPAPRRGRTPRILATAAMAALLAAAGLAAAQQPAGAAPAAAPDKAAAPKAAADSKAGAKAAGKPASAKADSPSYSLGVQWGQQLRDSGLPPDLIDIPTLGQGVRDAITGKVSMTDKDRTNLRGLVNSVGDRNHAVAAKFLAENGKKPGVTTTASGLQYKVVTEGSGESPKASDEVTVNYKGTLLNGSEFDNSYKRGQPAKFPVNGVIPGWTEALQLMKPGAKWQLWIPPQLAYDLRPMGPGIPPGSMLVFDVELLSVKAAGAPPAPPAAQK